MITKPTSKTTKIYYLHCGDNIPFYVGKTTGKIKNRQNAHQNVIKRNILLEVIDIVDNQDWRFWEKYLIEQFKQWGFNLTNKNKGGGGVTNHTKETKFLMSNIHKGLAKPMNEITKKKISNTHKNRVLTKNWKENISNGLKGRKFTQEWKDKIKNNTKNKGGKPVLQFDKNNIFIKEFPTSAEAEEYLREDKNRLSRNIANCCLGKTKSAYGYKWTFK
jgi:hypothetical protein